MVVMLADQTRPAPLYDNLSGELTVAGSNGGKFRREDGGLRVGGGECGVSDQTAGPDSRVIIRCEPRVVAASETGPR